MKGSRRRRNDRKINPGIFIFCEGKTEENYINILKSHFRLPSIIIRTKISGQNIDNRIISQVKKQYPQHEKDQVFLLYDHDVEEVVQRLRKIPNSTLLLSNPCIELWFLLHFKNQNSAIDCSNCARELKNRCREYSKRKLSNKLLTNLISNMGEATKRARGLTPFKNPSTTVHELLDLLSSLHKN